MSTLNYPNVIQNGQVADGDKLMENLNVIKAIINGDIDFDNLKAALVNAANGIVKLDENGKVPMEQLLTNVANGTVKLDENADVPLAQIPDTLTGKTAENAENADTVDGIHASTTGEAGKLIRADEVDSKIADHKSDASAHHTKTTDHGELNGRGDDDHPQYLTTGRHDTTARHPVSVLKFSTGSFSQSAGPQTWTDTFEVSLYAHSIQVKSNNINRYVLLDFVKNTLDQGTQYHATYRMQNTHDTGATTCYARWYYHSASKQAIWGVWDTVKKKLISVLVEEDEGYCKLYPKLKEGQKLIKIKNPNKFLNMKYNPQIDKVKDENEKKLKIKDKGFAGYILEHANIAEEDIEEVKK